MSNLAEFFEEDSASSSRTLFALMQAFMAEIPVKQESDDPIMDILQSNGVQYVHMNDVILEPSKAEEIVCRFPFDIVAVNQCDIQGSRELQEESEAQAEGQTFQILWRRW